MGYMYEFPHTRMFDSDLRGIIEKFQEALDMAATEPELKKLRVYTFEEFGAKGDGISDDTEAIQAAIDAGYSYYYLLDKTYIISKPINISRGNLSIVGRGIGSTIKLKGSLGEKPFAMIVAESTHSRISNIRLSNFTVNGNRELNVEHGLPDNLGNQSKYWVGSLLSLINLTDVDNAVIDNMIVESSWGSGIWLSDCRNCKILHNTLKDYRITGIALRDNTDINVVDSAHNIIDNNYCSGGVVGIDCIFGTYNNSITNNVCENNSDANRFPYYAYGGIYPNVYPLGNGFNNPMSANYISPAFSGDGAGIENTGFYTAPNANNTTTNVIANNNCSKNMCGIRLEEETLNCSISGNVCSENEQTGILLYSSSFITVSGNTCFKNGLYGIAIHKLGDVVNNGSRVARLIPANNAISGNTISGNGEYGISIAGARYNTIDGNIITGNNINKIENGGGIKLERVDDSAIEPIAVYGVEYNIITNNIISDYYGTDKVGIFGVDERTSGIENIIKDNIIRIETKLKFISLENNIQNITSAINNRVIYPNVPANMAIDNNATFFKVLNGICYVTIKYSTSATIAANEVVFINQGVLPTSSMQEFYVTSEIGLMKIKSTGECSLIPKSNNVATSGAFTFSYPIADYL